MFYSNLPTKENVNKSWKLLFIALFSTFIWQNTVCQARAEIKTNVEKVSVSNVELKKNKKPDFLEVIVTDEKLSYTKNDFNCLAKNVYYEARGEPKLGKYAVAQVTVNRVKSEKYSNQICSVVYQPSQFSWVNSHKKNITPKGEAWEESKKVAVDVLEKGVRLNGMEKTLFFHASHVKPKWSYERLRIAKIGLHIFYG